jgi:hypothetical protein
LAWRLNVLGAEDNPTKLELLWTTTVRPPKLAM